MWFYVKRLLVLCLAVFAGSLPAFGQAGAVAKHTDDALNGPNLVLSLGDVTGSVGDVVVVPLYYTRGAAYVGEFPVLSSFKLEYDPTRLESIQGIQSSEEMLFFYGSAASYVIPNPGRIACLFGSSVHRLTTFDDQIMGAGHDPNRQINPFPIGSFRFRILSDTESVLPLVLSEFSLSTQDANAIRDIDSINGSITVIPDNDADNDGIDDDIEDSFADGDNDGIPNRDDTDSDDDGIDDADEYNSNLGPASVGNDADQDGVPNFLDTDSDDDGLLDEEEWTDALLLLGLLDADMDNTPNFLDIDSDDNGILDEDESDLDPDGDTVPDFVDTDDDGDGLMDVDEIRVGLNHQNSDSDGDEILDAEDDDDEDGFTNGEEILDLLTDIDDPMDPPSELFVSSESGSDSNDGSLGAPFRTINHAIDRAVARDFHPVRIALFPELFEEELIRIKSYVVVSTRNVPEEEGKGLASARAMITYPPPPFFGSNVLVFFDGGTTGAGIENVELAGGSFIDAQNDGHYTLIVIQNCSVRVENVAFAGNEAELDYGLIIEGPDSGDTVVENCAFRDLYTGASVVLSTAGFSRNQFGPNLEIGLRASSQSFEALYPGAPRVMPTMGDGTNLDQFGLNRFLIDSVDTLLFVRGPVQLVAQHNDWGSSNPFEIRDAFHIEGDAPEPNFERYLSTRLRGEPLVLRVVDGEAEGDSPVDLQNTKVWNGDERVQRDDASRLYILNDWMGGSADLMVQSIFYTDYEMIINTPPFYRAIVMSSRLTDAGPGDVDGNGRLASTDLQHVINAVLGSPTSMTNSDVNGDRVVNASDVQSVINWILGVFVLHR